MLKVELQEQVCVALCMRFVDCSCTEGLAWQAMGCFLILGELQPMIVVNVSRSLRARNVPAGPELRGKISAIFLLKGY